MHFNLVRTPFGSPVAQALCSELHEEYVRRYGDGDETVIDEDDFDPRTGTSWSPSTPTANRPDAAAGGPTRTATRR
ncbi:hypothetical protein GCM10029992_16240 [Glycomyces albus]